MATALTDTDPMPFGKHRGALMQDVPASYLDWLRGQDWFDWRSPLGLYVKENESVIDKELKDQGRM